MSLGFDGEGARDPDALPLAARELVRVAPEVVGAEADRLQQVDDPLLPLAPRLGELVDDEGLADDRAHRHAGVQRRVGVLEDDLHVAPQVAQRALVEGGDVLVLEPHLARGGLDEAEDAAAGGGLAAARLAHEAERLALQDLHGDVVHRVDAGDFAREEAPADGEVLLEILDSKERRLSHGVVSSQ